MNKAAKRYEPYEQPTPCGKLFRVLDTTTGKYVSMSFHPWEEAQKICDRLNSREALGIQFAFDVCECGHPANAHYDYRQECAGAWVPERVRCECRTFTLKN